jgi:ssDNA-binding Zn-finger/Zn-ribbon topoisomerase 1
MSEKKVELKCPECGSERIMEWNNVPTSSEVESLEVNEKGDILFAYAGSSEAQWDISEISGYACDNFCFEGAIEDFVVKV